MEEIKICRNIEDFDGMENGFGLKLKVENVGFHYKDMRIGVYNSKDKLHVYYETIEKEILILKESGFKFEWKPKLSLDEVLKKYKSKPFKAGVENYFLAYSHDDYKYECKVWWRTEVVGILYYDKETIEKIIKELND